VCSKRAAATSGNPKLLNTQRGSDTALVNITWQNNHYTPSLFKNVYDRVKKLRSSSLQVEFTGNAFSGVGQSSGSGSSVSGSCQSSSTRTTALNYVITALHCYQCCTHERCSGASSATSERHTCEAGSQRQNL